MSYRIPSLKLGRVAYTPQRHVLQLDDEAFKSHLYVVGATRTGKTKFLENILRQIVLGQRRNGPGLLLLDPHGTLYHDLARYFAGLSGVDRPFLFVDPSRDDFVVPYNILRARVDDAGRPAEPSVIARQVLKALAYVWGAAGTQETPRFHRMALNLLHTLYLKRYTTNEAYHFLHALDQDLRRALTQDIQLPTVAAHWNLVNSMIQKDFIEAVESTLNRFEPLVSQPRLTRMFGHPDRSIDFRRAMDEGWIILCNLSTRGSQFDEDDAHLLGTLLLADLWATARDRGKASGKGIAGQRPFVVAMDEFQNFVTPTIAQNLSEASGFGLRLVLAHQYPGQITEDPRHENHGSLLMRSILTNARNKVVFGGLGAEEDIGPLADIMFRGVLDPNLIKDTVYSTKVLDYKIVMQEAYAHARSSMTGGAASRTSSSGSGAGHASGMNPTHTYDADGNLLSSAYSTSDMDSVNSYVAESLGYSDNWAESETDTVIRTPQLTPVLGKEISSRQFYPLEEQRYLAVASLYGQEQRQCVVRLVGMAEPASLFTPFIEDGFASIESRERFIRRSYERWPDLVLPADKAAALVEERRAAIEREVFTQLGPVQAAESRVTMEVSPAMPSASDSNSPILKVGSLELYERDLRFLLDIFDSRFTTHYHAALHYGSEDVAKRKLVKMEKEDLLQKAAGSFGFIRLPDGRRREVQSIYSFTRPALDTLIKARYVSPHLADEWTSVLRKRYEVGKHGLRPSTIDHEVGLLDIKAALMAALPSKGLVPRRLSIWPEDYRFAVPPSLGKEPQKPDGFIHLELWDTIHPDPRDHYYFYLEFDRGNEGQPTLLKKAKGYRAHREKFEKDWPRPDGKTAAFRTLFIFDIDGPKRLTNFCEKLVAENFGTQHWLTTLSEFVADPFARIWITAKSYKLAKESGQDIESAKLYLFNELSTPAADAAHSAPAQMVVD